MKRLYLALLWLFAVGFSSTSNSAGSTDSCFLMSGTVVTLSASAVSSEECKALFTTKTDKAAALSNWTLAEETENLYWCDIQGLFNLYPCGSRWYRRYNGWGAPSYEGYWQGISRNLTLTLARDPLEGGGSESSTILKSVEPGSSPVFLRIIAVDDNTGLPAPSLHATITADVIANSGGHQHDNNRNTDHSGLIKATATSGFAVTGKTVTTGYSYFQFIPPAASGDHTITVACDPSWAKLTTCSMGVGPNKVWVGVKDLQPLWEMADYNLIGWTAIHPDNHYLTSEAVTAVHELAYYYHSVSYPLSPVLHLNDASLERGGVFDPYFKPYTKQGTTYSRDIQGWWIPPHIEHRRGRVIDIRANGDATAIPRANQDDFEIMMDQRNMTYIAHDLNKDNGHYHVRLLGTEQ